MVTATGTEVKPTKKAAKKVAAPAGEAKTPRGRASGMFGGKKIKKIAAKNPFKEGSLIAKAYDIMRNGMTYEKYIEAGGRRIDLADAIKQGHVEVVE